MVQKFIEIIRPKFFGITLLTVLFSGCTFSSFFGDGKDQSVLKQRQYRQINRACAGMDLGSAEISVQTFRSLISCLNSNGALKGTEKLIELFHDDEVEAITNFLNRSVLSSNRRLYQIEKTFQTWEKTSLQADALGLLADVLEHRELLLSLLHVVKSGYYIPSSIAGESAQVDENVLRALQILGQTLDQETVRQGLDIGLSTVRSSVFRALRGHLLEPRSAVETEQERDQKNLEMVTHLINYLQEDHTFSCGDRKEKIGRELHALVRSNLVFPVLDQILGTTEEEVLAKLPEVNRLMRGLLRDSSQEVLFDRLAHSFFALGVDQSGPITCMKGAKAIPDATRYLIREMAEFRRPADAENYLSYEAPLTLVALGPFCQFPKGLNQHYAPLFDLVDSGVTESMVSLLQTLYRVPLSAQTENGGICASRSAYPGEPNRPWIDLLMHVFADGGLTGSGGVHHLTPVLVDAMSRGVLSDALLLSTVYSQDQRVQLNSSLSFLTAVRPELNQESILEVFNNAASRTQPAELYRFLKSLASFLSAKEGRLPQEILEIARRVHFSNDVTPFLDLLREVTAHLTDPANKKLFEAFFALAESHESEILGALEEWSDLARSGELKALIDSVIQIFHKFAQRGGIEIRETIEPALTRVSRHDLAQVPVLDLPEPRSSRARAMYSSCREMNLEFSLAHVDDPQFNRELAQFLACKGSSGNPFDAQFSDLLGRLNSSSSSRDSFLPYQLGALQQTLGGFDKSPIEYLVNSWMQEFPFTRSAAADSPDEQQNVWVRTLKAVPFWVGGVAPVKSLLAGLRSTVANSTQRESFEKLQFFGSEILESDDFPKLLSDAEVLISKTQAIQEDQKHAGFKEHEIAHQKAVLDQIYTPELREVLKHWVRAVECWRPGMQVEANVERRIDEIIHESQNRINTYELVDSAQGSKAPTAWTFEALQSQARPILNRLRDEHLSDPHHLILDSTFKFFQSATGGENPDGGEFRPYQRGDFWVRYSPEKLLSLFHKRARRVSPRIQYYKGHGNPYVVLDSELDLLEKTLGNVDMVFDAPPGKNIAFEFAQEIAHAWGDLPANQWPAPIAAKYAGAFHLSQARGFSDPVSWGEEDRRAYENGRPRTLREAVDGIISRPPLPGHAFNPGWIATVIGGYKIGLEPSLARTNYSREVGLEDLKILTEDAAGLPTLPQCVQSHLEAAPPDGFGTEMVRVVRLPEALDRPQYRQPPFPRRSTGHWAIRTGLQALKGPTEFAHMQGMIFNLWQAIDVLKQNVPGHPANDDGGLLPVMRDLFFEVYYSNPPSVLSQPFSSALVDQNQLVVVSQFLRLGVMHQVGLILQKFELNDPNLKAVFLSLMRGASSPEMPKLLRGLLHRDPEDRLIWSAIRGLTRAQGSQVDELKRLAFYLLAGMNRVDPWGGAQRDSVHSSIVDRALARSHEVTDEFYGWFASLGSAGVGGSSHRDISRLIEKLLDSKWGSSLAEALHQTMAASAAPSGVAALVVEAEGQQEDRPDRWRRLLLNALREPQDSTSRSEVSALIHLAKSTWEDAGAWDSWGRFFVEAQRVQNDRDYQGLSVSAALRPFLDFIEEKEVPSAEVLGPLGAGMSGGEARQVGGVPNGIPRAAAARELRQNLAKFVRYKQGSRSTALNELIQLAAEKPEEFDLLLRVLEQSIQGGQLIDFLKLVRRSLPQ